MLKAYMEMLDQLTARYNEEALKNYHDGLLDFVPSDRTSEDMLQLAIIHYVRDNYPEIIDTAAETAKSRPKTYTLELTTEEITTVLNSLFEYSKQDLKDSTDTDSKLYKDSNDLHKKLTLDLYKRITKRMKEENRGEPYDPAGEITLINEETKNYPG